MNTEEKVKILVDAGVFEVSNAGNGYRVAIPFQNAVDERQETFVDLSSVELRKRIQTLFDDENIIALVADIGEDDREFVAVCAVLAEYLAPDDDIVRTAPVLQLFRHGLPRAEGGPEAFLAVHGDQLATLTQLFPQSVVYVWRDDCDPCDAMRDTLDELFETKPDDLELFTVFGPDYAEALNDAFDIIGGPTTLFIRDGRVESRLQGAHHQETIESEVEFLRGE